MEALHHAFVASGAPAEMRPTGTSIDDADIVVVDSYRFRADDEGQFGNSMRVAIDELARRLAVDIVVDPTPGATPPEGPARHALFGARYALTEPDLVNRPVRPVDGAVSAILVSFGGADRGSAARVAGELADVLPGTSVAVAVPPGSDVDVPSLARPVRTDRGLGDELAECDLVVTAGGVTMLEALVLGRPTIAVVTADNQRRAVDGARAAGAVVEADMRTVASRAAELASDPDVRVAIASAGRALIDGKGAHRVAEAILLAS